MFHVDRDAASHSSPHISDCIFHNLIEIGMFQLLMSADLGKPHSDAFETSDILTHFLHYFTTLVSEHLEPAEQ